jgi:hypothetical protein
LQGQIGEQIEYLLGNRGWHFFLWNDSRLNFAGVPDLEGFKPFSDGFKLTPSFALDTTGASLI